jgi:ParB family chromosome partitioning protein
VRAKERGLGRGLDALFSGEMNFDEGVPVTEIDIASIIAGEDQPRRVFDKESLSELADSIKEHGILQPILVRPRGGDYEIIAGERRWRAAKLAGLDLVPVIIREIDDIQAAEISLIENLQRDDLSVAEEAHAYKNMIDNYGYTQELVARKIGKSRAHIANTIRILNLPVEILEMIQDRRLTAGHARSLLALGESATQIAAAREIIEGKLSVRETEKRVKRKGFAAGQSERKKSLEIQELERKLENLFGSRAEIVEYRKGGKIQISFYDDDDLTRISELLGIEQ